MADEDRMDSSDDEEEEGQGFNLSSFLWGNVDTRGQLEEDYMDEVWACLAHCCACKALHLHRLSRNSKPLPCRMPRRIWQAFRTHKEA